MQTELPAERPQRRLRAEPDADAAVQPEEPGPIAGEDSPDDDQNSLLPRWLPGAPEHRGWVARIRADPGRAGAIGLAIVAALAVLVTVFTLIRDRPLDDGEQIVVGLAPVPGQPPVLGSSVAAGSTPAPKPPPGPGAAKAKPKTGDAVDLNTATVQELDALPGVGPVTAAAIVAWRQTNGRFTSVDQLADVEGIGPARLEKLRALVRV